MKVSEKEEFEVYPEALNEAEEDTTKPESIKKKKLEGAFPNQECSELEIQVVLPMAKLLRGHKSWGFINSFSVFQEYYIDFLGPSPLGVSWIGSIQIFLVFFIGTFTGRLADAGYFHPVFLVGTILSVVGMFMASLSTKYWQLFLAQGICCGLGNGCLFCPALSVASTYISKNKMLAVGICACVSATGGLIFPVIFQQPITPSGCGWTMRIFGVFTTGCLTICNILTKLRLPPRRTGPIIELAAFKEASYTLIIQHFLILNGVGILGRTMPAYLADRYKGPMNILLMVTVACIKCAYAMIGVPSRGGLYARAVVYGIVGNALQMMFPTTLSSLTMDLKKAGVRMGMFFGSTSSTSLVSNENESYFARQS
ncbi:hypothetical protein EAF00_001859 [Botryotinia globosa]|nr:hypothetical protein EAF00_001859 [Botryotinia globosa]